ncbi:MAG: M48 family metallopeptidase, partial [Terriglobales bacterium]
MAKNSPEALATKLEANAIRDQETFLERAKNAELLCKKDPPVYQGIVAMIAMGGYAYIFAFLGFFIWAIVGLGSAMASGHMAGYYSVKLLVVLVIFAWIIIKALIVKIPTPKGTKLDRHDAPQLFALLDKLRDRLGVRIDEVLATPDLNACIVQIPRLGMLGWYKNYLVLGLPLLYGNTTEQFTAIVAHEMGHISGSHGETGSWIYSLSQSWRALLADMRRSPLTFYMFYPFFNWYYPYFLAYASVLNRQHEFEADRQAVQLTNPKTMAESLISLELRSRFLSDRFSKNVTDQMLLEPVPPENMYVDMAHQMQCPDITFDEAERWYLQALNRPTDPHDTHPALTDRLTDIGYPAADVE